MNCPGERWPSRVPMSVDQVIRPQARHPPVDPRQCDGNEHRMITGVDPSAEGQVLQATTTARLQWPTAGTVSPLPGLDERVQSTHHEGGRHSPLNREALNQHVSSLRQQNPGKKPHSPPQARREPGGDSASSASGSQTYPAGMLERQHSSDCWSTASTEGPLAHSDGSSPEPALLEALRSARDSFAPSRHGTAFKVADNGLCFDYSLLLLTLLERPDHAREYLQRHDAQMIGHWDSREHQQQLQALELLSDSDILERLLADRPKPSKQPASAVRLIDQLLLNARGYLMKDRQDWEGPYYVNYMTSPLNGHDNKQYTTDSFPPAPDWLQASMISQLQLDLWVTHIDSSCQTTTTYRHPGSLRTPADQSRPLQVAHLALQAFGPPSSLYASTQHCWPIANAASVMNHRAPCGRHDTDTHRWATRTCLRFHVEGRNFTPRTFTVLVPDEGSSDTVGPILTALSFSYEPKWWYHGTPAPGKPAPDACKKICCVQSQGQKTPRNVLSGHGDPRRFASIIFDPRAALKRWSTAKCKVSGRLQKHYAAQLAAAWHADECALGLVPNFPAMAHVDIIVDTENDDRFRAAQDLDRMLDRLMPDAGGHPRNAAAMPEPETSRARLSELDTDEHTWALCQRMQGLLQHAQVHLHMCPPGRSRASVLLEDLAVMLHHGHRDLSEFPAWMHDAAALAKHIAEGNLEAAICKAAGLSPNWAPDAKPCTTAELQNFELFRRFGRENEAFTESSEEDSDGPSLRVLHCSECGQRTDGPLTQDTDDQWYCSLCWTEHHGTDSSISGSETTDASRPANRRSLTQERSSEQVHPPMASGQVAVVHAQGGTDFRWSGCTDYSEQFRILADAADYRLGTRIGAILLQKDHKDSWYAVEYWTRGLTSASGMRWSTGLGGSPARLEALATSEAEERWQHLLLRDTPDASVGILPLHGGMTTADLARCLSHNIQCALPTDMLAMMSNKDRGTRTEQWRQARRAEKRRADPAPQAEGDNFGWLPDYVWQQMTDDEKRTHRRARKAAKPPPPRPDFVRQKQRPQGESSHRFAATVPDFVRREISHSQQCLPCIKRNVVQMRVDEAGKCPFDETNPDDPRRGHWRAWLGIHISGVNVTGWTDEARTACRIHNSKNPKGWMKYDQIKRGAHVISARIHNLKLQAKAANATPAASKLAVRHTSSTLRQERNDQTQATTGEADSTLGRAWQEIQQRRSDQLASWRQYILRHRIRMRRRELQQRRARHLAAWTPFMRTWYQRVLRHQARARVPVYIRLAVRHHWFNPQEVMYPAPAFFPLRGLPMVDPANQLVRWPLVVVALPVAGPGPPPLTSARHRATSSSEMGDGPGLRLNALANLQAPEPLQSSQQQMGRMSVAQVVREVRMQYHRSASVPAAQMRNSDHRPSTASQVPGNSEAASSSTTSMTVDEIVAAIAPSSAAMTMQDIVQDMANRFHEPYTNRDSRHGTGVDHQDTSQSVARGPRLPQRRPKGRSAKTARAGSHGSMGDGPGKADNSLGRLPDYVWEQMTADERKIHIKAMRAAKRELEAQVLARSCAEDTSRLDDDVWAAMSDKEKKAHIKAKRAARLKEARRADPVSRIDSDSSAKLSDDAWEEMTDDERKAHIRSKRAAKPKRERKPTTDRLSDSIWERMTVEQRKAHAREKREIRRATRKRARKDLACTTPETGDSAHMSATSIAALWQEDARGPSRLVRCVSPIQWASRWPCRAVTVGIREPGECSWCVPMEIHHPRGSWSLYTPGMVIEDNRRTQAPPMRTAPIIEAHRDDRAPAGVHGLQLDVRLGFMQVPLLADWHHERTFVELQPRRARHLAAWTPFMRTWYQRVLRHQARARVPVYIRLAVRHHWFNPQEVMYPAPAFFPLRGLPMVDPANQLVRWPLVVVALPVAGPGPPPLTSARHRATSSSEMGDGPGLRLTALANLQAPEPLQSSQQQDRGFNRHISVHGVGTFAQAASLSHEAPYLIIVEEHCLYARIVTRQTLGMQGVAGAILLHWILIHGSPRTISINLPAESCDHLWEHLSRLTRASAMHTGSIRVLPDYPGRAPPVEALIEEMNRRVARLDNRSSASLTQVTHDHARETTRITSLRDALDSVHTTTAPQLRVSGEQPIQIAPPERVRTSRHHGWPRVILSSTSPWASIGAVRIQRRDGSSYMMGLHRPMPNTGPPRNISDATRPQSVLPQRVPTSVPCASHSRLGEGPLLEQTLLLGEPTPHQPATQTPRPIGADVFPSRVMDPSRGMMPTAPSVPTLGMLFRPQAPRRAWLCLYISGIVPRAQSAPALSEPRAETDASDTPSNIQRRRLRQVARWMPLSLLWLRYIRCCRPRTAVMLNARRLRAASSSAMGDGPVEAISYLPLATNNLQAVLQDNQGARCVYCLEAPTITEATPVTDFSTIICPLCTVDAVVPASSIPEPVEGQLRDWHEQGFAISEEEPRDDDTIARQQQAESSNAMGDGPQRNINLGAHEVAVLLLQRFAGEENNVIPDALSRVGLFWSASGGWLRRWPKHRSLHDMYESLREALKVASGNDRKMRVIWNSHMERRLIHVATVHPCIRTRYKRYLILDRTGSLQLCGAPPHGHMTPRWAKRLQLMLDIMTMEASPTLCLDENHGWILKLRFLFGELVPHSAYAAPVVRLFQHNMRLKPGELFSREQLNQFTQPSAYDVSQPSADTIVRLRTTPLERSIRSKRLPGYIELPTEVEYLYATLPSPTLTIQ